MIYGLVDWSRSEPLTYGILSPAYRRVSNTVNTNSSRHRTHHLNKLSRGQVYLVVLNSLDVKLKEVLRC